MVIESELQNLWPRIEEFNAETIIPPVVILRQQAEFISAMTNNLLEGQVVSKPIYLGEPRSAFGLTEKKSTTPLIPGINYLPPKEDTQNLRYVFSLRPVALGNATIQLFEITHRLIAVYPVTFVSSVGEKDNPFARASANDEMEFRALLREYFHSDTVKGVLRSLMAQSR